MKKTIFFMVSSVLLLPPVSRAESMDNASPATPGEESIQQQLDAMQQDYDRRLAGIEERLKQTQKAAQAKKANTFNPSISLILNGSYADYENDPDVYQLPGFALSNEAGLEAEGFSLGESEVTLGASVDQLFYAQATFALADDAGETSIETEEAYFETLGLSEGVRAKAGRFYSAIGYINSKHRHTWDFSDAPLVYRAMFGDQLKQDGVQLSWILPTDFYFLVGGEAGNGVHYPSAGNHSGVGDWSVYTKVGGDIGFSHSWQLGLSHWQANDVQDRYSQGLNDPSYSGNSRIDGIDVVYKWAPEGNAQQQNLKLQAEFFHRSEEGVVTLNETDQGSSYDGSQDGWYAQAVYQFMPRWSAGIRYDRLGSDNTGSDVTVLDQAGLLDDGHTPERTSLELSWEPSEFSRIRAQFNRDDSTPESDNQLLIQYTMAMGAHGAHAY